MKSENTNVFMSDLTNLSIYNSCNVLGVRCRSGHLVEIVDQLSSIDNWYGVYFQEQTEIAEIARDSRDSRDCKRQFKRRKIKMRSSVKEQLSCQLVLKLGSKTADYFEVTDFGV